MNKAFYKKIINLIPSADMKNYVITNGFQFREKDLLKIILEYAPTFDKKLELFEEASRMLNDKKMRLLAKKRIAFEKRQYDAFMQSDDNIVYEIQIKTDPYAADEETYLTKTFSEAVSLIKSFIKCYSIKASELVDARYTILKKTTTLPKKPNDIYKDKVGTLGKCILNSKFRIIYLDVYHFGLEVTCKNVDCDECDRCICHWFTTHYPHFLKKYDLVAFYDDLLYNPKHLMYAICDMNMEECDVDSLVIYIKENPYIQNRNGDSKDEEGYYRIYDAHDHPSCFEIIKPNLQDVPQEIIDGYNYALPILKKIAQIRNEEH